MRYIPTCVALIALPLALASCADATQKAATVVSDTNAALSSPEAAQAFQMACWSITAADAAFQVFYVQKPGADAAVVADEARAMAGAKAICAAPPTDLASATKAVLSSYRAVTATVPAS